MIFERTAIYSLCTVYPLSYLFQDGLVFGKRGQDVGAGSDPWPEALSLVALLAPE